MTIIADAWFIVQTAIVTIWDTLVTAVTSIP